VGQARLPRQGKARGRQPLGQRGAIRHVFGFQRAAGDHQVFGNARGIVAAQGKVAGAIEQHRVGAEIDRRHQHQDRQQPLRQAEAVHRPAQPEGAARHHAGRPRAIPHQVRVTCALNM
jgi:hypothetical protein